MGTKLCGQPRFRWLHYPQVSREGSENHELGSDYRWVWLVVVLAMVPEQQIQLRSLALNQKANHVSDGASFSLSFGETEVRGENGGLQSLGSFREWLGSKS